MLTKLIQFIHIKLAYLKQGIPLTQLYRVITFHSQAVVNSFIYLCKQPISTGVTVVVFALTLTMPALLEVLADNSLEITQYGKNNGHISLYLDVRISDAAANTLARYVQKTKGVGEAVLKTPAEGLLELQQQEGMHDVLLNLPDNPLPYVIDVHPGPSIHTPLALENLYSRLKSLPGIEDAKFDMQWVNRLFALLDLAGRLTHGLMLILALAVVLIIGNTLRLVTLNRHEEIRVLKLIKVSDPYIMRSFLYSGLWYGFFSALLAVILVSMFMLSLRGVVHTFVDAYHMHFSLSGLSFRQTLMLIVVAMVLGWLGTYVAVRRQLALIEP